MLLISLKDKTAIYMPKHCHLKLHVKVRLFLKRKCHWLLDKGKGKGKCIYIARFL